MLKGDTLLEISTILALSKLDIGLASEGQNLIGSFIPINTNDFPIEATIIVTQTFENSDIDCLGQPSNYIYRGGESFL